MTMVFDGTGLVVLGIMVGGIVLCATIILIASFFEWLGRKFKKGEKGK